MARRAAEIRYEPEYAPDTAAQVRALKYVLSLPLDPTIALAQSESHARACEVCRLDGQDACPDGRWYAARAARASHTRASESSDGRPDTGSSTPERLEAAACTESETSPETVTSETSSRDIVRAAHADRRSDEPRAPSTFTQSETPDRL